MGRLGVKPLLGLGRRLPGPNDNNQKKKKKKKATPMRACAMLPASLPAPAPSVGPHCPDICAAATPAARLRTPWLLLGAVGSAARIPARLRTPDASESGPRRGTGLIHVSPGARGRRGQRCGAQPGARCPRGRHPCCGAVVGGGLVNL